MIHEYQKDLIVGIIKVKRWNIEFQSAKVNIKYPYYVLI